MTPGRHSLRGCGKGGAHFGGKMSSAVDTLNVCVLGGGVSVLPRDSPGDIWREGAGLDAGSLVGALPRTCVRTPEVLSRVRGRGQDLRRF